MVAKPLMRLLHHEHERAARRPGTEHRPRHGARGKRRAQEIRLEPLVNEVRNGHRTPSKQPVSVRPAERAKLPSRAEHVPEIAGRWLVDAWRRGDEQGRQHLRHARHRLAIRGIRLGIFRAQLPDGVGAPRDIVVELEGGSFEGRSKHLRGRLERLQPVTGQVNVANDLGPERADVMRQRGAAEPRMQLLGDGAAADGVAALEDDWPVAGLREIERRDETVVTTADDDYGAHVRRQELGGRRKECSCVRSQHSSNFRGIAGKLRIGLVAKILRQS
jgi:hypothetical protein